LFLSQGGHLALPAALAASDSLLACWEGGGAGSGSSGGAPSPGAQASRATPPLGAGGRGGRTGRVDAAAEEVRGRQRGRAVCECGPVTLASRSLVPGGCRSDLLTYLHAGGSAGRLWEQRRGCFKALGAAVGLLQREGTAIEGHAHPWRRVGSRGRGEGGSPSERVGNLGQRGAPAAAPAMQALASGVNQTVIERLMWDVEGRQATWPLVVVNIPAR
jgi:hypothetical protein